jgi:hypothetical protein
MLAVLPLQMVTKAVSFVGIAVALCFTTVVRGQPEPTPLNSAKEGTYYSQNMYSTTVLELKDGRFRYWFSSDLRGPREPSYPLTGNYRTNGGTITLAHKEIYQTNWTFMTYEGKATLWRPTALNHWNETRKVDPWGVLYPTVEKSEVIWERKGFRKKSL